MKEESFHFWDVLIKALGFLATALSIYLGLTQFGRQQYAAMKFEFDRKYYDSQVQTYSAICREAGSMVVNISSPDLFAAKKKDFLILYYGESNLVDDSIVANALLEVRSYADVVDPKYPNSVITFKSLVFELDSACRSSSAHFRKNHLSGRDYGNP